MVVILINNFFLPDTFRDLRNNEISWAIEDASEAFAGLKSLTKLYVSVVFVYIRSFQGAIINVIG